MTWPSQKSHDDGGLARFGLLLLLVAFALSGCDERREYSYRTLADAVAAGETTRGWLPDWLPPSSRVITLFYSADSPQTWGAFEFSPAEMERLRQHLTPVVAPSTLSAAGTSWWPDFLCGTLDQDAIRHRGFNLYGAVEPGVGNGTYRDLFAVSEAKGLAFFYRNPAEGAR